MHDKAARYLTHGRQKSIPRFIILLQAAFEIIHRANV